MNVDIERVLLESPIPVDPKCIDEVHQRLFKRPKRRAPEHYEIHEELGRGRFGRVYRATDKRFPREIALKVIAYDGPRQLARLEREAHALARLSHPNIVAVFEKGIADVGNYYLATELVDGARLDTWMKDASRSLDEILRVFAQAADGLHHAHQRGLIHRDFKPSNAIVDAAGRLRILDFGLVKLVDESSASTSLIADATQSSGRHPLVSDEPFGVGEPTRSSDWSHGGVSSGRTHGHVLGTPAYASLEQLEGRGVDSRSDQFSLCIALFEACHGFRPFAGRTVLELSEQIVSRRVARGAPKRRIPWWLKRLLARGLLPNPEDRFEDVGQIAKILRAHLCPTRPWVVLAASVGLTLGIGGGILMRAEPPSPPPPPEITLDWSGAWPEGVERAQIDQRYGSIFGERLAEYERSWQSALGEYAGSPDRDPAGKAVECLGVGKRRFHEFVEGLSRADESPASARAVPAPFANERIGLAHLFDPRGCLGPEAHWETNDELVRGLLDAQAQRLRGDYVAALATLEPLVEHPSLEDNGPTEGFLRYEMAAAQIHLRHPDAPRNLTRAAYLNGGDAEFLDGTLVRQLEVGMIFGAATAELDALLWQLDESKADAPTRAVASGQAFFGAGDFAAAKRSYAAAREAFATLHASAHRDYMIEHCRLHEAYAESHRSNPEIDFDLLEPAVHTVGKMLGGRHPLYLQHATNVARMMNDQAQPDRAYRLLAPVLAGFAAGTNGPSSFGVISARAELLRSSMERSIPPGNRALVAAWLEEARSLDTLLAARTGELDPWQRSDAFQIRSILFATYLEDPDDPTNGPENRSCAFHALDSMATDAKDLGKKDVTCHYHREFQRLLAGKKTNPAPEISRIEARLRTLCG